MHPGSISIKDFSYVLPADRIARYPLPTRDESKLLVYQHGQIGEDRFFNLHSHLPEDAFLIFNNTRVVEARILFRKPTGGVIELFCLEPDDTYGDITTAMLQMDHVRWKCLVGGAKKWKAEKLQKTFTHNDQPFTLSVSKDVQLTDYFLVDFTWDAPGVSFADVLHLAGAIPLPPYMNREAEESDKDRYQTIYARHDGSVAAPTAGLHFTDRVFNRLREKNIHWGFVTLHVGAGTFRPVKAETMQDHDMHAEYIDVSRDMIVALRQRIGGSIIPVGTTSLRTIESLYWLGVKCIMNSTITPAGLQVFQWDAYETPLQDTDAGQALDALLEWMRQHSMERLITKTQLIIPPGYTLRIAKAIITNFHQPDSTLLLLVAAFTGDDWKRIYQYALEHDFRFLSYGDSCLLFPAPMQ